MHCVLLVSCGNVVEAVFVGATFVGDMFVG